MKKILLLVFLFLNTYSAMCQHRQKRMAFIITVDDDFPDISDFSESKFLIRDIKSKVTSEIPFRYDVGQLLISENDYNKLFRINRNDTVYIRLATRNYRLDTDYVYEEKIPTSMINDLYLIIKIYNKKKVENMANYIFPENKGYLFQVISPGFHTILKRISNTSYNPKDTSYRGDAIKLWNYKFKQKDIKENDSVRSLGSLIFYRTRPVIDSSYYKIYKKFWTPEISFDIFNISDSTFCRKLSTNTRYFSSCVPPDVGGDYFVIGQYIFLNRNVCLNCRISSIDYCRPVVNFVFNKLDKKNLNTLTDIFKQFAIKKGEIPPNGINQ